jgi:hypothetical protein
LRLDVLGWSLDDETGKQLFVSGATVKTHLTTREVDLLDRVQAVVLTSVARASHYAEACARCRRRCSSL